MMIGCPTQQDPVDDDDAVGDDDAVAAPERRVEGPVSEFRGQGIEVVIGVGGGAAIDTAKALLPHLNEATEMAFTATENLADLERLDGYDEGPRLPDVGLGDLQPVAHGRGLVHQEHVAELRQLVEHRQAVGVLEINQHRAAAAQHDVELGIRERRQSVAPLEATTRIRQRR